MPAGGAITGEYAGIGPFTNRSDMNAEHLAGLAAAFQLVPWLQVLTDAPTRAASLRDHARLPQDVATLAGWLATRLGYKGGIIAGLLMVAAGGFVVAKAKRRALSVQADVRNLANRLNVINFAGLFSGTALGAPRSRVARAWM